jgi:hypothetical protein
MDHINQNLAHLFQDLPSTDREWNKHDSLVEIGHGDAPPELGFMARMMVLCTLPHSDPGEEVREFKRQNGDFKLIIQAGPEKNLPSGSYPRLLIAWICREIIRTKNRKLVLGDSLSDFMRELGLKITGGRWGTITRLREQMERTLSARVMAYFATDQRSSGRSTEVATDWDLWWDPKEPEQAALWESTLTVGERLYKEVVNHPVPFDMRVMREVKQSPLAIDLYLFLTYRLSYLKKPTAISWRQLHDQFGADYSGKYGYDNFRKECLKHLSSIEKAWPSLHYETPRGRLKLFPCGPHIAKLENPN